MAETQEEKSLVEIDEEETVTLDEFIKEEERLEEDAYAVLGGSDPENCTYSKGYMKRQALYACMTCTPEAKDDITKAAGVCLACSYNCHEGHDLIELYTKRNFCCDCGNDKFKGIKCKLVNSKPAINEQNAYNQNFIGLYCTCKKPYPDPDDPVEDEMIQCIICEDWYHLRHLTGFKPSMDNYSEMICMNCIEKHKFISNYSNLIVKPESAACTLPLKNETVSENGFVEKQSEVDNESSIVDIESSKEDCKMPKCDNEEEAVAKFMIDDWRKHLCKCSVCIKMYEEHGVPFLVDVEDTVQFYEDIGKAKRATLIQNQGDPIMAALSNMDRVTQIEAITGFNTLKTNLSEYLNKFAENKKVVREEDIKEFFSKMAGRKKQRIEVPFFCR